MENDTIKYYLETNAIYSLVNKIDLFVDTIDVATSLYAYEELINGINDKQYHKRKVLITKMKESKLKIYTYLPMKCIAISFGLDISNLPIIQEKKELLWKKVNLVISSDDYAMYTKRLGEIEGIELSEEKKFIDENEVKSANKLRELINQNHSELKAINERRKIQPEYHEINVEELFDNNNRKPTYEHEKEILIQMLQICEVSYEDSDINDLVQKYDGRQLVAFIFGEMAYTWHRSYYMKPSGNNDISDLTHLLYLKDENYVIVSNDKIYTKSTLAKMRITCNDFLEMCEKAN